MTESKNTVKKIGQKLPGNVSCTPVLSVSVQKQKTKDCKYRTFIRIKSVDNIESRRKTYQCAKRPGVFLFDVKCVGFGNSGCPLA